jgi:hypothetical protein
MTRKATHNKGYTPGGLLSINGLSYFYQTFDAVWANSAWYSARRIASNVGSNVKGLFSVDNLLIDNQSHDTTLQHQT